MTIRYNIMVFRAIEDRLLLRGNYYSELVTSVSSKARNLGLKRKLENFKIKKAIKAGELDLELDE